MTKETFCTIMCELDNFFNHSYPQLEKLGMVHEESPILKNFDNILVAVHEAIDPKNIGENLMTKDSPLLFDYLFVERKGEKYRSFEEFYDYVQELYEKNAKEIETLRSYSIFPF